MYSRSGRQIRHGYSVIRVSLDDHSDHGGPRRCRRMADGQPLVRMAVAGARREGARCRPRDSEAHADHQEPDPTLGQRAEGPLRASACGTDK